MTNHIFQIDRKPPAFCPAISQWDLPFRIFPPRGLLGPTGDTTMVLGKFWRPNMGNCISKFPMCKHFSHFSHFGPFKAQAKCNVIRAYCLNLVPENAPVHIGRNIKGTTKGWLPKCCVYIGECAKGTQRDDIVSFCKRHRHKLRITRRIQRLSNIGIWRTDMVIVRKYSPFGDSKLQFLVDEPLRLAMLCFRHVATPHVQVRRCHKKCF